MQYLGFWLLIALAFNMWALLSVLRSGVGPMRIAIWAVILLIPVIGFFAWFMIGPRRQAA